jgi:hypothetical protein
VRSGTCLSGNYYSKIFLNKCSQIWHWDLNPKSNKVFLIIYRAFFLTCFSERLHSTEYNLFNMGLIHHSKPITPFSHNYWLRMSCDRPGDMYVCQTHVSTCDHHECVCVTMSVCVLRKMTDHITCPASEVLEKDLVSNASSKIIMEQDFPSIFMDNIFYIIYTCALLRTTSVSKIM